VLACTYMRRIVASLVLSVMAWTSLAPLALALTGPAASACCRRSGKHHCMETAIQDSQQEKAVKPSGAKCPMFTAPAVLSSRSTRALPTASQSFYSAIAAHPALWAQVETSYLVCWSRSRQKRGPPTLAS
jgi:hypothetical protein